MSSGIQYSTGDIVLVEIHFPNGKGSKKRPALVLFNKYNNIVVAGMTSNLKRNGIKVTAEEGCLKDSVIRLDYIFTISSNIIERKLFKLNKTKQELVFIELIKHITSLLNFTY
ncbi:MAG: type II toxin-antitoxin system PemK/MazF family toxin [Candidatus Helarchaeota archaeon]